MCGIQVTLKDDDSTDSAATLSARIDSGLADSALIESARIVVRADPDDPFSKGSMCPKAPALSALHTDPSRLRKPVKRVDGDWIEISWDEAYATIEANLKRIRKEHGADSIASYLGNPIVHNMGTVSYTHLTLPTIYSV